MGCRQKGRITVRAASARILAKETSSSMESIELEDVIGGKVTWGDVGSQEKDRLLISRNFE